MAEEGAPFELVPKLMDELIKAHNQALDEALKATGEISHDERLLNCCEVVKHLVGNFIAIHPFIDGNGTVSRILWAMVMERLGFKSVFQVVPRPKSEHYAAIMNSAMRKDFSPISDYIYLCRHR